MPRITISIPADLRDRLNDPAVKKSLNISRVCQEALARQVRRLLDLPLDVRRMERVLLRLKSQREEASDRWYSIGAAAARDWVEHEASHADLRKLGEAGPEERIRLLKSQPPSVLLEHLERHKAEEDFSEQSFLEGWAQATGLLWQVIKPNL